MDNKVTTADRGGNITRERILAAAESVLDEPDTEDLTLKDIAARLGMHYTAVYHYFTNRDDLELQLIKRYCTRRSSLLSEISLASGTGAKRLQTLIEREMEFDPTPLLIRGRSTLSEPYRSQAIEAYRQNRQEVELLIEIGIEDGSFRPVDTKLVSHLICRILDRFADRHDRVFTKNPISPEELSTELCAFFTMGISNQAGNTARLSEFSPKPIIGILNGKLELMLHAATISFNINGWRGTSIPRLATSLNMSKTVFYSYAASKNELLFLCAMRSLSLLAQTRQQAASATEDPLLVHILENWFLRQTHSDTAGPLLTNYLFRHLSAPHYKVVQEGHTNSRTAEVERLRQLAEMGLVRASNPLAVQLMIISCRYLRSVDEFHTDTINNLILRGIGQTHA